MCRQLTQSMVRCSLRTQLRNLLMAIYKKKTRALLFCNPVNKDSPSLPQNVKVNLLTGPFVGAVFDKEGRIHQSDRL